MVGIGFFILFIGLIDGGLINTEGARRSDWSTHNGHELPLFITVFRWS